ncbi:LysR family transcriptional regulator [Dyella humicola]|uniref:LysR family transcriptional regulator n=1 Tax=Dyella humicola TaxID=2992126 RepID=UPI00225676A7|nr:LysR family transcriptional regulator [Dyella humicola]
MDLIAALQSFLRVAQTGSFSAVAAERGVTQPAVSRQVSALEDYLGIRLVHRSTQAVTLTDEGREFVASAQHLVDAAEALQHAAGHRRGKPVGRVRIALPVTLGLCLSRRLGRLLDQCDELSVDIILRDGVSDMIEEGLDLEVRLGPIGDSSLVARHIGHTSSFLVAAPSYLIRHAPPRHPLDLQRHDCIIYPRWGRDDVWWFYDKNGEGTEAGTEIPVTVHGRLKVNHADAAYHAVLDGCGIALMSHLMVSEDIHAGRLHQLLPDFPTRNFPLYVVYPSRRSLPPRTCAVIDYLMTLMSEDTSMALDGMPSQTHRL